jgi:2-oxoglutarate dehydrogenase complex dehydrogenase (E1) component-like enzyme
MRAGQSTFVKGRAGQPLKRPMVPSASALVGALEVACRGSAGAGREEGASAKQGAVSRLIQVYMNRGHLIAKLDPLGMQERAKPYVLDLEYFGLSPADLDTEFFTGSRNVAIPERARSRRF